LEEFVKTVAPHFAYQIQLKSGDLEPVIRTEEDIKKFLSALYGGRTDKGEVAFDAGLGILLDKMFEVKASKLLSEEVGSPSILRSPSMFDCQSTDSQERSLTITPKSSRELAFGALVRRPISSAPRYLMQ
jgi:hypothetical protein